MAWIESHQELGGHPKTKRLARALGVSIVQVVGHLHFLWWWALDYADDGALVNVEVEDIADAAMWEGDPKFFVDTLVNVGFLDCPNTENPTELHIHDWWDYAGRLVEKRNANADRMRQARAAHVRSTVQARAYATVPTVPNQDQPIMLQPKKPTQTNGRKHQGFYQSGAAPFDLAVRLRNGLLANNPKAGVPDLDTGTFQGWCHNIDLLLKAGKDPPEVEAVIDWSQKDEFWHVVILSARKLREKYDQLYLKMRQTERAASNGHAKQRGKVIEDAPISHEFRAGDQLD